MTARDDLAHDIRESFWFDGELHAAEALAKELIEAGYIKAPPLDDARLAAIEAREKAATEGPWVAQHDGPTGDIYVVAGAWPFGTTVCEQPAKINAEFIAHARSDIPHLLTCLRAEIGRRESLFAAIAHGDDDHRRWLKDALDAHFAGRSVPPPYGKGKPSAALNGDPHGS